MAEQGSMVLGGDAKHMPGNSKDSTISLQQVVGLIHTEYKQLCMHMQMQIGVCILI